MNTFSGVRTVSAQLVEVAAPTARARESSSRRLSCGHVAVHHGRIRLAVGARADRHHYGEMFTAVTWHGCSFSSLLKRASEPDKFFVPVILLALLGVILSNIVEKLQNVWRRGKRRTSALIYYGRHLRRAASLNTITITSSLTTARAE